MKSLPFHPALEGLRGLAVLLVLLFHGGLPGVQGGFLGVSTFFTLSGFLITGLLLHEAEGTGRIRLTAFWARRLRRLMPAALAGLSLACLLAVLLGDAVQLARLRGDGLSALFYLANWWLIGSEAGYASLMGSPSWLQHYWSLAIEEQYYALFPLVAWALLRRGRIPLGVLLALATVASWAWMAWLASTEVSTERLYYGTDTRAGELLLGGLLAVVLRGRSLSGLGMRLASALGWGGLLFSAGCWYTARVESAWLYEWGLAVYALATVAVLFGATSASGSSARLLGAPPLRWLGRISYGVYVYHWPVFLALDAERTGLAQPTLFALRVGVTLLVSVLSHRLLEAPIRAGGGAAAGWMRAAWPAGMIAVASLYLALAAPLAEAPRAAERSRPMLTGGNVHRFAMVGDSVAQSVFDGLQAWAADNDRIRFYDLAQAGCGLSIGAWPDGSDRGRVRCDHILQKTFDTLAYIRPKMIVALTSGWDLGARKLPSWPSEREIGDPVFDEWLVDQYVRTAERMAGDYSKLVWLTTPCTRETSDVEASHARSERVAHMNQVILPRVVERSEVVVGLIDLRGRVCPGGNFTNRMEGIEPFRPDGIHFSPAGERWVADWLAPRVINVWLAQVLAGKANP